MKFRKEKLIIKCRIGVDRMNIMRYDANILDNIIINANKKELYQLKEMIDEELNKKAKESEEEYRKSKSVYLFKCYETDGQLIKIIDFDFSNKYSMVCICLDWSEGDRNFALTFDSIGLFCNDFNNPGHKIIERYKEISEEEFRV